MIGEGLSPYVKSGLPFAMHFDERATTQVKKQMDLTL